MMVMLVATAIAVAAMISVVVGNVSSVVKLIVSDVAVFPNSSRA